MKEKTYLKNKREAAAHLGVSLGSLERLIRSGDLPYVRVGNMIRLRPEDLTNFINKRRVQRDGGVAA